LHEHVQVFNQMQLDCTAAEQHSTVLREGYSILQQEVETAAEQATEVNERVFDAVGLSFKVRCWLAVATPGRLALSACCRFNAASCTPLPDPLVGCPTRG
jgi:hypothetical protein